MHLLQIVSENCDTKVMQKQTQGKRIICNGGKGVFPSDLAFNPGGENFVMRLITANFVHQLKTPL